MASTIPNWNGIRAGMLLAEKEGLSGDVHMNWLWILFFAALLRSGLTFLSDLMAERSIVLLLASWHQTLAHALCEERFVASSRRRSTLTFC